MTSTRTFMFAAVAALSMTAALSPARAEYPERGITLIVPYGAGGGTDITARLLARDLEPALGKPVTVIRRLAARKALGASRR